MATINLGIKTSVDLQGINQLKKQIQELQNMLKNPYGESILSGSFSAKETLSQTFNISNVSASIWTTLSFGRWSNSPPRVALYPLEFLYL